LLAASAIYSGRIGIAVRTAENGDGYYACMNKNSVYILKSSGGKKQILKKETFKPKSNQFYKFGVICDKDSISLSVDGKSILSAKDSEFSSGMCGLFAEDITVYCRNVTMSLLEKVSPPIISEGGTVYYIDSAGGDDFNDGKTPETAWRTLDKPEQCTFAPGDKILLKNGLSYEGTLSLEGIAGGTDAPFVISSYGEGAFAKIYSCGIGLKLENCKNIEISDINFNLRHYGTAGNLWTGMGYGIFIENCENVVISGCTLEGPGEDMLASAIGTDEKGFDEITVDDVNCAGFVINGISVNGEVKEKTEDDGEIKGHWAYKYMKSLKRRNIITEYRPDDKVTRAEFSSMLVSALNLAESDYRGIFRDVSAEDWYAVKLQTVSDYRLLPAEMAVQGNVKPNEPLLREEAAAVAVLAGGAALGGTGDYTDITDCDEWSLKYIKSAADMGVMSGKGDGSFKPKDEVTRAEAAVILIKLTEYTANV
jgi:hypothetical protein